MTSTQLVRWLSIPLFLVLGAACGKAPVPLAEEPSAPASAPAPQGTMPDDDIHSKLMAQGAQGENPHQGAAPEAESYAGVVRLRGDLATRDPAFLFVSVMPKGSNRPVGSTKVALADPALGTRQDGERAIPFVLENVAKIPEEVELQVWFDLDGFVDTKEDGSLIRRFPIEHAASNVDVALDPSAE